MDCYQHDTLGVHKLKKLGGKLPGFAHAYLDVQLRTSIDIYTLIDAVRWTQANTFDDLANPLLPAFYTGHYLPGHPISAGPVHVYLCKDSRPTSEQSINNVNNANSHQGRCKLRAKGKLLELVVKYARDGGAAISMALIVLDSKLSLLDRRLPEWETLLADEFQGLKGVCPGPETHYDCDVSSREWTVVFVWVASGALSLPIRSPTSELEQPDPVNLNNALDAVRFYSALCRAMSRARTRLVFFFDSAFYDHLKVQVPAFDGNREYLKIDDI